MFFFIASVVVTKSFFKKFFSLLFLFPTCFRVPHPAFATLFIQHMICTSQSSLCFFICFCNPPPERHSGSFIVWRLMARWCQVHKAISFFFPVLRVTFGIHWEWLQRGLLFFSFFYFTNVVDLFRFLFFPWFLCHVGQSSEGETVFSRLSCRG